jgi:beta-lactamase regulating signal transducer with metallopeptidase domain
MLLWFAETTLIAALLALVAALAGKLRSIGPATRHLLWLAVLIKMMTPPLFSWPWTAPWGKIAWPTRSLQSAATAATVPIGSFEPRRDLPDCPDIGRSLSRDSQIVLARLDRQNNPVRSPGAARDAYKLASAARPWLSTWNWQRIMLDPATCTRGIVVLWLIASVILCAAQGIRVVRFRRRLFDAVPAPELLVEQAEVITCQLGLRAPELLVVPNLGTPLLWCLGRPKLLLPAQLVKSLPALHWRGILTHELAHLRRGDHWVSRLELAAGLIWWWNPLYWLTRARLDAEAELACDAWVVWAMPEDRITYAEILFDICATLSLSPAHRPAPALGVAGSGRFFERRLTMILHDHVPCRLSPVGLLTACLLVLLALPSWSATQPASGGSEDQQTAFSTAPSGGPAKASVMDDDEGEKGASLDGDDDADDDEDDADDRDDDDKAELKAKRKAEAAALKAKAKALAKLKAKKSESEMDDDLARIEKEIEAKLAPIEKEIEAKLAPIEKDIEGKFGPGSDFERKMEEFGKKLGKEMEAKCGPGSEFQKKMEAFGKEMEAKFGPGSEFQMKIKEQIDAERNARKEAAKKPLPSAAPRATEAPTAKDRRRERRIREIEAQINKLSEELKALRNETDAD